MILIVLDSSELVPDSMFRTGEIMPEFRVPDSGPFRTSLLPRDGAETQVFRRLEAQEPSPRKVQNLEGPIVAFPRSRIFLFLKILCLKKYAKMAPFFDFVTLNFVKFTVFVFMVS